MNKILITGASRGVGRALAIKCASTGDYDVVIINCARSASDLEETARIIKETNPSIKCITSVGDIGDITYVEELYKEHGSVDTLINNAAISYVGLLIDMTPEEWNKTISTNISSIYNTCHTYAPDMIRNQSGRIINISSVWGLMGASCEVAYSTTKGAVNSFTKALAKELGPSNVAVNAIALGIVDTEMNRHLTEEEKQSICDDIPIGYMMRPEDAAEAIYMVLQMPTYLTGEVIKIDGGWQ